MPYDRRSPVRRLVILFLAVLVAAVLGAPAAIAQGGGQGEPTLDQASGGGAPKRTADYRQTLRDAVADIQAYWADEFPQLYGERYAPIPKARIIAAHPGVKLPPCQGKRLTYHDAQDNAFYCYRSNFIAYDDVGLFPGLNRDFGRMAVALVLAHEWGHAIEDRAGNAGQDTILKELQADCFAGAWLARVANGESEKIELEGGNLDSALAAMLNFRDPVGTAADEQDAHGSGFDRASSFQTGFDGGAEACVPFYDTRPIIFEVPFTDEQDALRGGNMPAEDVIPTSVDLLNDFYRQVEPAYVLKEVADIYAFDPSSKKTLPTCGGTRQSAETVRNRVFYCIDDGNFGFDEPYLQHVYEDIGDFGVTTLLANPFATYVQTLQDFPGVNDNADNAVLGADCYTGGFAAAMFNGALLLDDKTGESTVTLSPGDLDETIAAYADYSQARGVQGLDVTFARLRAFRDGFFNGYETCSSYADTGSVLDQPSG
jgi:predicted metalloprotease